MRARSLPAALVLVLAAAPALAADPPAAPAASSPKFNLMGPASCADWPKSGAITSASKAVPLNWALGFLSGSAAKGRLDLLDLVDPDDVDRRLTAYCQAHPADTLPSAVLDLQHDLEAKLAPAPGAPEPMFVPPTATKPAPAAPAKPAVKKRAPRRKASAK